jgi:molybdate transport system substrate-binding protein
MRWLLLLLTLVLCASPPLSCSRPSAKTDQAECQVIVAAAADLTTAFRDIGETFEKASGAKVEFSFGASGTLARQIAAGAPFDVFASANLGFVEQAVRSGTCFGETRAVYAIGRLAVWAPRGSSLPGVLADLADSRFAAIALADPEHAPYGAAARQALMAAGIWERVQSRVISAENVGQALEFARSGRAMVAMVALSLAVVAEGEYTLVDDALYSPLDQVVVLCNGDPKTPGTSSLAGRQFSQFLVSETGRTILRRHGFRVPGEDLDSDK